MKKEQIVELLELFESVCYVVKGVECWSARELQVIFEYSEWRNFLKVIEKAKQACESAMGEVSDHFVDVNKMVGLGSGSKRPVEDIALTRYACYLVAQNGDPVKPAIAFAQTYFAVQTRKQEIIEKRLIDVARVNAREKLSGAEKKLSAILYEKGVDENGFAIIRSRGDQALFGGLTTNYMKRRLGVPGTRPLADFLSTLVIKAKDFTTELTSHNVVDKNLQGESIISKEHIDNNLGVRKILNDRGVKPENLPPGEDTAKVKRRLESDEKKVLKEAKKRPK
jgi:DNA-damage-inducible protein D